MLSSTDESYRAEGRNRDLSLGMSAEVRCNSVKC